VLWGQPPFFIAASRDALGLATILHRSQPRYLRPIIILHREPKRYLRRATTINQRRGMRFTGANVQAKAARATDEPANQHNARGARSLFGRKLGIAFLGSRIK